MGFNKKDEIRLLASFYRQSAVSRASGFKADFALIVNFAMRDEPESLYLPQQSPIVLDRL